MKQFRDTPYYVSKEGTVFRFKDGAYKPITLDSSGLYLRATLSVNGLRQRHSVHRMVAECYLPNPMNKPQVNHKDLNKYNNHVSNLEWVTAQENTMHGYLNSTSWGNIKASNKAKELNQIKLNDRFTNLLDSLFIGLESIKGRTYISFSCPQCKSHQLYRVDSTRFKEPVNLLCRSCKQLNKQMKI